MFAQERALENGGNSLIERLAKQLGMAANARYIYAEPVERDGTTVIPVAKAAYGFGGGSGKKEGEEGSGGGGGVSVTPVGYIEMKNGETRFRPTHDWLTLIPIAAATAPIVLFSAWIFTKLLRPKETKPGSNGQVSSN